MIDLPVGKGAKALGELSEQAKETRGRILKAAEDLFSEKGFDGTSVSQIADKAGVTKPLIYYYFKNKRGVLDSLTGSLLDEVERFALAWVEENYHLVSAGKLQIEHNKLKLVAMTQEEIDRFFEDSFSAPIQETVDFFLSRRKTLHIMAIESLKKGPNSSLVLQIVDLLNEGLLSTFLEQSGFRFSKEALVDKFFLEVMPVLSFALYCDQWSERYGIAHEELKATFIQGFKEVKQARTISLNAG